MNAILRLTLSGSGNNIDIPCEEVQGFQQRRENGEIVCVVIVRRDGSTDYEITVRESFHAVYRAYCRLRHEWRINRIVNAEEPRRIVVN